MAMEMKRLSLNSDGALRTTMHSRMPHTSTLISTAMIQLQNHLEMISVVQFAILRNPQHHTIGRFGGKFTENGPSG